LAGSLQLWRNGATTIPLPSRSPKSFPGGDDETGQVMYLLGSDAEQAFVLHQTLPEAERLEMIRQHTGL
ncbi:hypothetical protein, partial [Mesorhizobium sp. M1A.F.Ca.IN.022.07.1.1]|uniref:hypothetical protein n=1 Tax=Mesorhizobium sp. M1A.F.Ca.IN.022.07.1.1 TaxID=2496767 RepID=UPI0019D00BCF